MRLEGNTELKCPKCGSRKTAPIMYGLPAYTDELKQSLDNKKIVLGGCCISASSPQYHCFNCNKEFGSAPLLISKHGEEDYRAIVTSIYFCVGGFFQGHKEITFENRNKTATVNVLPDFHTPVEDYSRSLSNAEWETLLNKLYCKLFLHEWRKQYDDPNILDGTQWSLKIKLTGNRQRNYYGSNLFPAYWRELKTLFRPYFEEAGISL